MKHHVVALTAFALLLFFTSADCASAQGNNIRGKVRTAAGGNVASVTVTLESGNGAMISQTVTNNEGDFAFTGLDQTSYILVITAANYSPASERVDFYRAASLDNPGETRTVELTLSPNNGTRPPRVGLNFVQVVPDLARQAYERAARLLRENKQTEAIQAMREALKLFPDYFNARLLLASEVLKAGDISQAVTQLDAARRINPNDDRVFYLFGIAMTRQRKYAVAARVFAEASRLSPLDAQYPLLRGTALVDQSAVVDRQSESAAADLNYIYAEAEKELARAFDLSGKRLPAVNLQLARLYEKKGERARAASALEHYLKQSPNAPNAAAIRDAISKLRAPSP